MHSIEWVVGTVIKRMGDYPTKADFFIRLTYLSDNRRWVTLQKEHLTCDRANAKPTTTRQYACGGTVLVE